MYAWRQGAEGEAATARTREIRLQRSDVVVIHDRRIPGRGRANIDRLAIGPGGVTVIDSKSSRGRVQLSAVGIVNRRELLLVDGRDRTSQLDALERQIARVANVLDRHAAGDVAVLGALTCEEIDQLAEHSGQPSRQPPDDGVARGCKYPGLRQSSPVARGIGSSRNRAAIRSVDGSASR